MHFIYAYEISLLGYGWQNIMLRLSLTWKRCQHIIVPPQNQNFFLKIWHNDSVLKSIWETDRWLELGRKLLNWIAILDSNCNFSFETVLSVLRQPVGLMRFGIKRFEIDYSLIEKHKKLQQDGKGRGRCVVSLMSVWSYLSYLNVCLMKSNKQKKT